MSTITTKQEKQIILIITYIILIHFEVLFFFVFVQNLPSAVTVFFKSLRLLWKIYHKSIKSNR